MMTTVTLTGLVLFPEAERTELEHGGFGKWMEKQIDGCLEGTKKE